MLAKKHVRLFGVGVCVLLVGCGASETKNASSQGDRATAAAHAHPTEGPHGGHLIELGLEEYHAELLHDEDSHTVTIYLLDSTVKQPVSIDVSNVALQIFEAGQFLEHTLETGDDAGQFLLVDEKLCDMLLHSDQVKGRLKVTISGQDYVGIIQHVGHDH